ncbi:MAG TPA: hypothetical protein ENN76_01435 [Euryarchaeota archaeon]|nr:hypothetical protein [Euryarchaeota archaeon]
MPANECINESVCPSQSGRIRCNEITLVGCGSAGCNMVDRIVAKGLPKKVKTVFINSDDDSPNGGSGMYMGLSRESLRRDPYPEVRFSHYEDTLDELVDTFGSVDVAVFLMSMGGQVGTAIAPVAAKAAYIAGATSLGFAIMPFSAEKVRHTRAKHAIGLLKEEMPNTVILENDKLVPIAGKKPIGEAFSLMDTLIWKKIKDMMEAMEFSQNYEEPLESPKANVVESTPSMAAMEIA